MRQAAGLLGPVVEKNLNEEFPEVIAGQIMMSLAGRTVTLELTDVRLSTQATGAFYYMAGRIPAEWRPKRVQYATTSAPNAGETQKPVRVTSSGQITIYRPADVLRLTMSWPLV